MDKLALITDIHANLEALEAVLADINKQGIENIVSLGDNVGYGPNPVEVLQTLYKRGIFTLEGNHDLAVVDPESFDEASELASNAIEWTRASLCLAVEENIEFQNILETYFETPNQCALPEDPRVILVHGCPGEKEVRFNYLLSPEDFIAPSRYMMAREMKICFFGHTHRQILWEVDKEGVSIIDFVIDEPIEYSEEELTSSLIYINPGSVGQPRDNDPAAAYAIYEQKDEKHIITFKRVNYDIEKTAEKIYAIEFLDDRLGTRLSTGS